ncbi:hypothetical protein ACFP51_11935 [Streptomyces pratens]|uniref:Uncharacterized protein n=1 Tax=Streptomyces pratens TaxID=887456 RepID=A0ABW1LU62_9ACTN
MLTHGPRPALAMEGGTAFIFVTDGIHSALDRAKAAAGDGNVDIAGGASTVRGCGSSRRGAPGGGLFEVVRVVESPVASHLKYRIVK